MTRYPRKTALGLAVAQMLVGPTKETPRPWHVGFEDGSGRGEDGDGSWIVAWEQEDALGLDATVVWGGGEDRLGVRNPADAALIVRAVNAHDDLVGALRELVSLIPKKFTTAPAFDNARAVLAALDEPGVGS